MKKVSILLSICIALVILISGCKKKCDEFNEGIIDWMPYKVSDKIIIFNNITSDTLIVNNSEIYHTKKIGAFTKCACSSSFYVSLSSDSFNINVSFNESRNIEQSQIVINNGYSLYYSEQFEMLALNGYYYSDVVIYRKHINTGEQRFNTAYISKSIGIIGIVGENDEWYIHDNSKKILEMSRIAFTSTDC